jgi:hypothetical protein
MDQLQSIGSIVLVCMIITAFVLSIITFINERKTNKDHVKNRILIPSKIVTSTNENKAGTIVTQTFTYKNHFTGENKKFTVSHDESLRFIYDHVATNKTLKCIYISGGSVSTYSRVDVGFGDFNYGSSPILLTESLDYIDFALDVNIIRALFNYYTRQSSDDHTASDFMASDGSRWKLATEYQVFSEIISDKTMRLTLKKNNEKVAFQPDHLLWTDFTGIVLIKPPYV